MFRKLFLSCIVVLMLSTLVFAQTKGIDGVKNGIMHQFSSKTINQTMVNYPWFKTTSWQEVIMDDGKAAVIAWNIVDINMVKKIQSTGIENLVIGFRFVFKNQSDFVFDRIIFLFITQDGLKDHFFVYQNINAMYREVYTGNSRFVINVVNAINKSLVGR